jgi:type IV pilus assembly protein PilV
MTTNSLLYRSPGRRRRSAGFSLIEVLVSIVILSFGLLGMVGLQATALQTNRDARLQSSAILLARELAEMMRGNKDVALLASGNPYLVGQVSSPLVAPTPTYCLAVGSTCATPAAAALAEMTDWLARVDAELPGATVSVCRDAAPYDSNGLPVWTCTSASAADPILVKMGWSRASKAVGAAVDKATAVAPAILLPVTPGNAQ